jgi:3-methyladenine DNA glycosylase AlkD
MLLWTKDSVVGELEALADRKIRAQMPHFGVIVDRAFGVSAPALHRLARRIGRDHHLAQELWRTGIHEARSIAILIDVAEKVTPRQMERWAKDFDAWDLVDAACCYLFAFAKPAWGKVSEWSCREEEFVKRAAFSLIAYLSYKDKVSPDARFEACLRLIEREAHDPRNFVKKAVNWALRNIGKRNLRLNRAAIRAAERIRKQESQAAKWVAADALRELRSDAVRQRLQRKMI